MQPVDVLCDDSRQLSLALKRGQAPVRGVGLRVQRQHFFAVKPEKGLRLANKKAVAENGLGRHVIALMIQPVNAAEIWNPRRGTDAGAAKKDDALAACNHFFQCLIHSRPSNTSINWPSREMRMS